MTRFRLLPRRLRLPAFCLAAALLHPVASPAAAANPSTPLNVRVPPLAFDEQSVVLVWEKPADCAAIVDYNVYQGGRRLGGANANNARHSPAKKSIDAFYAADTAGFHHRISIHNFTVTALQPDTEYTFTVRSVDQGGRESADSHPVVQRTTPVPKVFDIVTFGARGDGVKTNTREIQAAIDACTPGGKVLVPAGVFKTGALFLRSNLTFEIAKDATLLGSEDPAEYPLSRGYRLYPYSTNDRPPSLLNALAPGEAAAAPAFTNLRIVGAGTLDGQGWKHATPDTLIDESGRPLPQYIPSNNKKVGADGRLARTQVNAGVKDGLDVKTAYGQRRSSLITLRGVTNVYYSGFTVLNPANHGLMNLECQNVVVNGITETTFDANNADGLELGNCDGALVFNCFFDTGDDSVNFAAGTGSGAEKQPPQQNAWIFNNYCREGHGAVVVGSHTGAWIQKILAEDNVVNGTDTALRCKSSVIIGGGGRDIVFRDSAVRNILKQPFIFTLEYSDANAAYDFAPAKQSAVFRDITVSNVTVEQTRGTEPCILVKGAPEKGVFHERINFANVTFRDVNPAVIDGLKDSTFKDVVFQNLKPGQQPWTITNSTGLSFEGSTAKP